jgi:hypothetical protein
MATSQALQRVLAHKRIKTGSLTKAGEPTMEGIYLSKLQLKTLGEQLLNMNSGPDGVCFMVGVGSSDEGKPTKTVEVILYKNLPTHGDPYSREIFKNNIFRINAGGFDENSVKDLIFDSDGNHKEWKVPHPTPEMIAAANEPITQGSQRTPPPFS